MVLVVNVELFAFLGQNTKESGESSGNDDK